MKFLLCFPKIFYSSTRDVEAEAVEAVKVLWKQKHFGERSWKYTQKQLTFWGAGRGINFIKHGGSG